MMKSKFIIIIALLIGAAIYAGPFWRGTVLAANEVKTRWGSEKIDFERFRNGTPSTKAKMSFSIMTDKSLKGKPIEYIREKFGQPDGFYFIDSYPAYIIQEGENEKEDTWQIVFLLNQKYSVRDIIVHRNCCDR